MNMNDTTQQANAASDLSSRGALPRTPEAHHQSALAELDMQHPASLTRAQRDELRSRWAGEGAGLQTDAAETYTVVYRRDRPSAAAFKGRAIRPAWRYSFRDEARRDQYAAAWIERIKAHAAQTEQRRAERKTHHHALVVGDVLRSTWGYDQTNVNFYEVVALIGRTMVEIRAIAQRREAGAWDSGECSPIPGQYIGAPQRRRVTTHDSVRLTSYASAYRVEPLMTTTDGTRIFGTTQWSAGH